jgi:prepilin-type N-terminal cleavage/methylation domain-containing protein
MKKFTKKAFTLVELLVVITILAIISVVAYQSFGGATDKAVAARKISDVATIESSLQQYKVDKKFYPAVDTYSATNMWGYDSSRDAKASNTLKINKNGNQILEVNDVNG